MFPFLKENLEELNKILITVADLGGGVRGAPHPRTKISLIS